MWTMNNRDPRNSRSYGKLFRWLRINVHELIFSREVISAIQTTADKRIDGQLNSTGRKRNRNGHDCKTQKSLNDVNQTLTGSGIFLSVPWMRVKHNYFPRDLNTRWHLNKYQLRLLYLALRPFCLVNTSYQNRLRITSEVEWPLLYNQPIYWTATWLLRNRKHWNWKPART